MQTPFRAYCANCGAGLKYPIEYQGRTYGSECIKFVTGQALEEFVLRRENARLYIDEEATAARHAEREARVAAERERQAELESERAERAPRNEWLAEVLAGQPGDFCAGIARELRSGSSLASFSDRQVSIMADIYAKAHGRRGSKKYDAAYDEFWGRLQPEAVACAL